MTQAMKQEYQKILISCFTSCFKISLASHLLHDFCNVNMCNNVRKVVFHEARRKHGSTVRKTISKALRKYPVLYDKADWYFKDKAKKQLAWEDVIKEANLENCKFLSKPKKIF